MARKQEFYKGRRKRRNYAIIPSIIIVGLITLIVVLFYGMQKYAVITKEGVSIELPILNEGKTTIDAQGNEVEPVWGKFFQSHCQSPNRARALFFASWETLLPESMLAISETLSS